MIVFARCYIGRLAHHLDPRQYLEPNLACSEPLCTSIIIKGLASSRFQTRLAPPQPAVPGRPRAEASHGSVVYTERLLCRTPSLICKYIITQHVDQSIVIDTLTTTRYSCITYMCVTLGCPTWLRAFLNVLYFAQTPYRTPVRSADAGNVLIEVIS